MHLRPISRATSFGRSGRLATFTRPITTGRHAVIEVSAPSFTLRSAARLGSFARPFALWAAARLSPFAWPLSLGPSTRLCVFAWSFSSCVHPLEPFTLLGGQHVADRFVALVLDFLHACLKFMLHLLDPLPLLRAQVKLS